MYSTRNLLPFDYDHVFMTDWGLAPYLLLSEGPAISGPVTLCLSSDSKHSWVAPRDIGDDPRYVDLYEAADTMLSNTFPEQDLIITGFVWDRDRDYWIVQYNQK